MGAITWRQQGDWLEPVYDALNRTRPACYLAGPEGFNVTSRGWMNHELIPLLTAAGLEVISPWEITHPDEVAAVLALPQNEVRDRALAALRERVGKRNHTAMLNATFMVASLEGPDVDSGTASEIGAFTFVHQHNPQRGKIVGYRTDYRASGDLGSPINFQVMYWIEHSGGKIVTDMDQLHSAVQQLVADWHHWSSETAVPTKVSDPSPDRPLRF